MSVSRLLVLWVGVAASLPANGQEPLSDSSWNFRSNGDDRFHSNESWLRPWQSGNANPPWPTTSEDSSGVWVGNYTYSLGWSGVSKRPGGSFSYSASRDNQFHAWTYLYTVEPKTIQLSGGGDCVPNSFFNGNFGTGAISGSWARSLDLNAGWNRVDLTGYNQNNSYSCSCNDLAALVDFMDSDATLAVPLPGDYNVNGVVDAGDYVVWRDNLGSSQIIPNDPSPGVVTQEDYDTWKNNFGQTSSSGTASNAMAPEPTTLAILVVGILPITFRSRSLAED